MENENKELTPAEIRLRTAGWSRGKWTAFLLECTEDEIGAIASAETGDDLRKVLDAIEDRKNPPKKKASTNPQTDSTVLLEHGWTDDEEKKYREGANE